MTEKKLHIVFLARWYPHRYDPMFGLFVQRHAEAAALYNDVSVVYVHADETLARKFDIIKTDENNVETVRVYYKKTKSKILSLFRFIRANTLALKMLKKPDIIHVHVLTRCGCIALWQKVKNGTPYYITEHWSRYLPGNDFHGVFRRLLTRIVVRNATAVTTVTRNLADAMRYHGLNNKKYVILPNVVDINLFRPIEKHNVRVRMVHVSCFEDKSKNISGLIDVLVILKSKNIDFQCTFIGDGIDFDAMRALAYSKLDKDNISFTGLLQGESLAKEIASSDFLVLSSNYENMPVVILEALSCGIPVVSTDVGGIKEIIDGNSGILVRPKDTWKLAEAVMYMIENLANYDARSLRDKVSQKYSYKAVGVFLSDLYKKSGNI